MVSTGHGWIRRGSTVGPLPDAGPGDIVSVQALDGTWLARALYCPGEPIVARVLTRDPNRLCDASLFRRRALEALERRRRLAIDATQYRLINAEGDGLPGVVVDRYADYLVVQLTTPAANRLVTPVITACTEKGLYHGVFLNLLPRDRRQGDLPPGRWIHGAPGPDELVTQEGDIRFLVRPFAGLSTGIFLDQRDNRRIVAGLTRGLRVLNTFAYTGGFSVACARAGADVATLDISRRALEWARENFRLNDLPIDPDRFIREDTSTHLRAHRGRYDAIILDPPAFSTTRNTVWEPRRIPELHEAAFAAVRKGGTVVTFSNMRTLRPSTFLERITAGARRAGRRVAISACLEAGMDFPWDPGTPETRHLKGFVVEVS